MILKTLLTVYSLIHFALNYIITDNIIEEKVVEKRRTKYIHRSSTQTRNLIDIKYLIEDKLIIKSKKLDTFQAFHLMCSSQGQGFKRYFGRLKQKGVDFTEKILRINQYEFSLLSCVLLNKINFDDKQKTIKFFLDENIKITNGDRLINNLFVYDNIPDDIKGNIVLFLLSFNLLPEIKKIILAEVIDPYRSKFSLLN